MSNSIVSLSGYKTLAGIPSTDTSNDTFLTAIIPAIENEIEVYLGYNPLQSSLSEVYNGTGNNFIRANNPQIQSINSIVFNFGATNSQTISGSKFIWDSQGLIAFGPNQIGINSGCFPAGFQNIQINYIAGVLFDNISPMLKRAVSLMVLKGMNQLDPKRLLSAETLGDMSFTYGRNFFDLSNQMWDDVKRILDLLKPIKYIF